MALHAASFKNTIFTYFSCQTNISYTSKCHYACLQPLYKNSAKLSSFGTLGVRGFRKYVILQAKSRLRFSVPRIRIKFPFRNFFYCMTVVTCEQ
jgi:hypothetical protein